MNNNIWIELSEESKEELIEKYRSLKVMSDTNSLNKVLLLEELFGINNLNPKQPIKTWEDYMKVNYSNYPPTSQLLEFLINIDDKISNKLIATIKISKLIEAGYGGMVTEEEWLDYDTLKYCIVCIGITLEKMESYDGKEFITFHTREQRDEFFKNNKQLCKDYYMIS